MKIIFGDLLPGETPIDDVTGLKIPGITTRRELSLVEAEGIRRVLLRYFGDESSARNMPPIDFDSARRLHEEMFGEVWDWAGRFRVKDLNLGVPFAQVQERLFNLFEDLEFWDQHGMDPVEKSARLHHRSVEIHPFANGNGRWARLLTNIWLANKALPPIAWPEPLIGDVSPIRGQYLDALKAADQGDIEPLLAMHRQFAERE